MVALTNPLPLIPEKRPPVEGSGRFRVVSDFEPAGDQPEAIAELTRGIAGGERDQVLLGVTGSGKTFTVAKVIENLQRPALVLAPNKTLAAQLYAEMKAFFPDNAVEYFVSYYDYYQRRLTSRGATPTSKKTPPSTSRSTACGTRRHARYSNAMM